jgi:hypothetical protein
MIHTVCSEKWTPTFSRNILLPFTELYFNPEFKGYKLEFRREDGAASLPIKPQMLHKL